MPDPVEVLITASDAEWLAEFTHSLINDRLCASGNITPAVRSLYRWRGEIFDRTEARVALHTRQVLVPAIMQRVKAEHPYEVPGVVVTPIVDGNPEYLAWIEAETANGESASAERRELG